MKPGSVFLSYASQDATALKQLRDALEAAGIEVWFDQRRLEGGDDFDQQIKKNIRACSLFVPVISAHTQARHEGYFRLEWNLAVGRAKLIAETIPFILPVVIDPVSENDALVPRTFPAGAVDATSGRHRDPGVRRANGAVDPGLSKTRAGTPPILLTTDYTGRQSRNRSQSSKPFDHG